ncbi:MAG: hypothetical protein WCK88_03315 [bacterium]
MAHERYIFTPERICTRDANTAYSVTCRNSGDTVCTNSLVSRNMLFKLNGSDTPQSVPLVCAGSICSIILPS